MLVIISLLSSADPNFDSMVDDCVGIFVSLFDWAVVNKALFVLLLSSLFLAVITVLRQEYHIDNEHGDPLVDSLVAGIIPKAVLLVYLAFLSLQLDYIIVKRLPIEFSDTERLVKSGFWQLFILSIINIGLFYRVYKTQV